MLRSTSLTAIESSAAGRAIQPSEPLAVRALNTEHCDGDWHIATANTELNFQVTVIRPPNDQAQQRRPR